MTHGAKSGLGKAAAALCAGLCCIVFANAQAQSGHPNQQQQERREERREARRDFRDSRWNEARQYEGRAEEPPRRLMEDNRDEGARRMGRMTQEERRDLRRQINEAGQQVYSHPPRR